MTCPVWSKDSTPEYRPFCSRRCADIDLGRWLNESYRVPVEDHEQDDASTSDAPPQRPQ